MDTQWVIIIGNLYLGVQTVHGLFKEKNDANQWANVHVGNQPHIIVPLNSDKCWHSGKHTE